MPRLLLYPAVTASLLLCACSQQPAEVVYKGSSGSGSMASVRDYNNLTPSAGADSAYIPPEHSLSTRAPAVGVQAVGVSDLPPPAQKKTELPATKPSASLAPKSASIHRSAFIQPVDGSVTSYFGPQDGGIIHDGITISGKAGAPVRASADGTVAYVGNSLKGYGNMVIIKHAKGHNTTYAHLQNVGVKRAQSVKQGDVIGRVGTHDSASPEIYFSLRKGNAPVDPFTVLPSAQAAL